MNQLHLPDVHMPHLSEEQKEVVRFDSAIVIGLALLVALAVGVITPLVAKLFS